MSNVTWGLMGLGRSGPWQIDLDETTSGPDAWHLTVDGPSVYLTFEIKGPMVVEAMLRFFEQMPGEEELSAFIIGKCLGLPVVIARDTEFTDRFFVRMDELATTCIFTLVDETLTCLKDALRQIIVDLAP